MGATAATTPDLDHFAARAVRALSVVRWVLCQLLQAAARLVTRHKHRGLTHSLAFAALVGATTAGVAARWWAGLTRRADAATAPGSTAHRPERPGALRLLRRTARPEVPGRHGLGIRARGVIQ